MSTLEERKLNDQKVSFAISEAAGTNEQAALYLELLAYCARICDDIFDDFHLVTPHQLLSLVENLFVKLPSNSFYCEHRDLLFSQHLVMWNAWEASNMLTSGTETQKIYAHVLRDYIVEILPIVALLTQGHDKMKEINVLIRTLFCKQLGD